MSVFTEISIALALIQPSDIENAGRLLPGPDKDEEVLGVAPECAQQLWALAHESERQVYIHSHSAKFSAKDKAEANAMTAVAQRFEYLASVLKRLAWIETYDHIGERGWLAEGAGIRAGYVVVVEKGNDSPFELVPMAVTSSMADAVRNALKRMVEAREAAEAGEEKKDKIQ